MAEEQVHLREWDDTLRELHAFVEMEKRQKREQKVESPLCAYCMPPLQQHSHHFSGCARTTPVKPINRAQTQFWLVLLFLKSMFSSQEKASPVQKALCAAAQTLL